MRTRYLVGREKDWSQLLVFRAMISLITSSIIVVGLLASGHSAEKGVQLDTGLMVGMSVLLVPSVVYLFGVSSPWSTLLSGAALIGINGVAWGWYYVSGWDGIVFSGVGIAFALTLLSVVIASVRDRRSSS